MIESGGLLKDTQPLSSKADQGMAASQPLAAADLDSPWLQAIGFQPMARRLYSQPSA